MPCRRMITNSAAMEKKDAHKSIWKKVMKRSVILNAEATVAHKRTVIIAYRYAFFWLSMTVGISQYRGITPCRPGSNPHAGRPPK